LWRNWQTEARLILRPKPRNHRDDFDAQINKPKLPVLWSKPENPSPPWFWGSIKKSTTGFDAKSEETVVISFEAKLEKTVTIGFDAKPEKTVTAGFEAKLSETITVGFEAKPLETVETGFEAKPVKNVRVVLRSNHSQIVAIGFEAQIDEKPSKWFWGQTTHKLSTLVLRINQETRVTHLHVHGVDRTWRHLTSRSLGHQIPNLCDHPPILCTRSLTPAMILIATRHTAPATFFRKLSANTILQTKQKKKKNKMKLSWIRIQTSPSQWFITIKPRNWSLGFSYVFQTFSVQHKFQKNVSLT
jgi:hypothetical protein